MQARTPTGMAAIMVTVLAAALPARPGSTAWAGMSVYSAPADSRPSSVVAKRTPPAVMQTVPAWMGRSPLTALLTPKRSFPLARVATPRISPRRAA